MNKLEGVDADALRGALDTTTDAKAAKRLMVALSYIDGDSVATLSRRYAIPKSTLYYWLDRFAESSVEEAIEDEPRPGRPTKLDANHRTELRETLDNPPGDLGFDEGQWSPELVQSFIESEYGVSYSVGHVRRLMRSFDDE
ncbi:MAG: helix-turn-helix domain-containing protein [Halobacteriota archaeon]